MTDGSPDQYGGGFRDPDPSWFDQEADPLAPAPNPPGEQSHPDPPHGQPYDGQSAVAPQPASPWQPQDAIPGHPTATPQPQVPQGQPPQPLPSHPQVYAQPQPQAYPPAGVQQQTYAGQSPPSPATPPAPHSDVPPAQPLPPELSPRRRKGHPVRTTVLTLLGMIVVFALAFGASSIWRQWQAGPACETVQVIPRDVLPKPGAVTVNVYNSTDTQGLARKTADELQGQGFGIGQVSDEAPVQGVGEIRYGSAPGSLAKAQLLAAYVPGATLVETTRTGDSVSLVLGSGFTGLASSADVDAVLASPSPSQSGAGCPSASPIGQ